MSDSSAFRAGGPNLEIMTLRTETADAYNEKIGATLKSKELSLKDFQENEKRKSRYQRMDMDDRSMLKSAISRVVTDKDNKSVKGETLEQL